MKKIIILFIFIIILVLFNAKALVKIYVDYKYKDIINNNQQTNIQEYSNIKKITDDDLEKSPIINVDNYRDTHITTSTQKFKKHNDDLELLQAIEEMKKEREKLEITYKPIYESNTKYRCDGRTWCSQMHSCEEAIFFSSHCSDTMDGNHDGIPCERQWCGH